MDDQQSNAAVDPIVISLEGSFHGLQNPGWNSKLIQFPRCGVLWGLHLSKQPTEVENTSRIIGCLICFGPIKGNTSNWSITFDHVFTLAHKRVGCAGTIQKSCVFSESQHIINCYEWGDDNSSLPVNWELHDSAKLSCHMYISQTTGIDRNMFKTAAEVNRVQDYIAQTPPTSLQVECQVMKCFGDLLLDETISFSDESMEAAEKLAEFFLYQNVIDLLRRYLMRLQGGVVTAKASDTDEESRRAQEFDLSGFDYVGNPGFRKQRMNRLRESDIISIFQHLCSIAFKKN